MKILANIRREPVPSQMSVVPVPLPHGSEERFVCAIMLFGDALDDDDQGDIYRTVAASIGVADSLEE